MSDTRSNWRELAEMLGLPTDEPTPPQTTPPPAPASSSAAVKKAEPAPEPVMETFVDEYVPPVPGQADEITSAVEFEEVSIENDEVSSAPALTGEGEATGDNDKSPEGRRRRRGRRGRRRGREDEAPVAEGAERPQVAPSAVVPSEEGDDDKSDDDRPGRRRRRVPRTEVAAEGTSAPQTAVVADDEGQDDDFSQDAWADWNVPNWQELIDGLYRPDRDR